MAFVNLPAGNVRSHVARQASRPSRARNAQGVGAANINQLGKVWAFDVTLTAMLQAAALQWIARLNNNTGDGHRWTIPQGDLIPGSEGAPRVAGAGQLGTSLNVDGVTASMAIPEGAFVSIITAGRRRCYQMAETVTANGSGAVTLVFNTPLRVAPADNDVVEIKAPKVEGLVDFSGMALAALYQSRGGAFTITERG
ncbi:MAG: hypothetical protein ACOC20_03435 [Oceanicaulis sp.]